MPRSSCKQWISGEWLEWHRCEAVFPPEDLFAAYFNGLYYFFMCQHCKTRKPQERSYYTGAGGSAYTDDSKSAEDPAPPVAAVTVLPAARPQARNGSLDVLYVDEFELGPTVLFFH